MDSDKPITKHVCELTPEEKAICDKHLLLRRGMFGGNPKSKPKFFWSPILKIDHQEFILHNWQDDEGPDSTRLHDATWLAEQLAKALARMVRPVSCPACGGSGERR